MDYRFTSDLHIVDIAWIYNNNSIALRCKQYMDYRFTSDFHILYTSHGYINNNGIALQCK